MKAVKVDSMAFLALIVPRSQNEVLDQMHFLQMVGLHQQTLLYVQLTGNLKNNKIYTVYAKSVILQIIKKQTKI